MRLIDADKIVYMWKQDINGNFHDGVTLESIVGKTPTVNVNDLIAKELEKIKEEIQGLIDFEESCCGNTTLGYECLMVINESIEAIRGKNIDKERTNESSNQT